MSSSAMSLVVFACVFGAALVGMLLRTSLPQHHLIADSKEIVKVGMGLVATMAALILGLLVSSAKSSYDSQSSELTEMSERIVFLDRVLAHYGSETKETRDVLRRAVLDSLDRIWPQEHSPASNLAVPSIRAEGLIDKIQSLSPKNDAQRSLQAQALNMAIGLGQIRWLLSEQQTSSVSKPLLAVLIFWLTAIFLSFGLFAPPNATVITALCISSLSVSGAIFLILEMYTPFSGLIKISSAPLRFALAHLGQ
jgi:UDP-N-acetylmuramyl pentapeptide phosphotransferase/UDP-N-acetylglucosamine-1-phosphate transferase